jgi:excinuclease ABC subunit A
MPSVYAPCPTCHGARYNAKTLEIKYHGRDIAQVLDMTVEEAQGFFAASPHVAHTLKLLREIGVGYLRLGQPATELSGGEAQRIKLITELQRQQRGATLYVIDEPTIGLHPADVDKLMTQLNALVEVGNTVIVAEHEMRVAAEADWLIDMGPGAGDLGGRVVASGPPGAVAAANEGRTAPYLAAWLASESGAAQRAPTAPAGAG